MVPPTNQELGLSRNNSLRHQQGTELLKRILTKKRSTEPNQTPVTYEELEQKVKSLKVEKSQAALLMAMPTGITADVVDEEDEAFLENLNFKIQDDNDFLQPISGECQWSMVSVGDST